MNGDGFGVGVSDELSAFLTLCLPLSTGWYDSVYDEELGSQPCIFTSVTPVSSFFFSFIAVPSYTCFDGRLGIMPISLVWRKK